MKNFSKIAIAIIIGTLVVAGISMQVESTKIRAAEMREIDARFQLLNSLVLDTVDSLGASGNEVPTAIALFETSLASSISSSATSFTLVSATDSAGNTMASSTYGFIIDEGTASQEMVLADCTATACTNVIRGLSPITGTTTVSSLRKEHRRGASVKITDGPQLLILSRILNGEGTLPNAIYYGTLSTSSIANNPNRRIIPTADYVDDVASAGCANAGTATRGCIEFATALEAASSTVIGSTGATLAYGNGMATDTPAQSSVSASKIVMSDLTGYIKQRWINLTEAFAFTGAATFGSTVGITGTTTMATTTSTGLNFNSSNAAQLTAGMIISGSAAPKAVMFATSTANVWLADGDVSTTTNFIGFAKNDAASGGTVYVQTSGIVGGFSGLTAGLEYYVSDTAGSISSTVGTSEMYVGQAISTTQILLKTDREGQYLGSQSLTCNADTALTYPWARYGHIVGVSSDGTSSSRYDATLYKVGKTTASIADIITSSASRVTLTWTATSSIRVSRDEAATSCSGTIYLYK